MAMPGETLNNGADPICPCCKQTARIGVYHSGAGWYIGSYCGCGPYTRESLHYWQDESQARLALRTDIWERR